MMPTKLGPGGAELKGAGAIAPVHCGLARAVPIAWPCR
jgi:hypothetical protein